MITGIKKLVEVAVTVTVLALAMPALASTADAGDMNEYRMYFNGIYSVSNCSRPQVRVTISEAMGMKIPSKTSDCSEPLAKELLNDLWDTAVSRSNESKDRCYRIKDAMHEPSWYQFSCYVYTQRGYGDGSRCDVVNKVTFVYPDTYNSCYR